MISDKCPNTYNIRTSGDQIFIISIGQTEDQKYKQWDVAVYLCHDSLFIEHTQPQSMAILWPKILNELSLLTLENN